LKQIQSSSRDIRGAKTKNKGQNFYYSVERISTNRKSKQDVCRLLRVERDDFVKPRQPYLHMGGENGNKRLKSPTALGGSKIKSYLRSKTSVKNGKLSW
jgi:hypothetical protein